MTQSEYKKAQEFCNNLPSLRAQVSDRSLLDQCQTYLAGLLPLAEGGPFDPEPKEEEKPAEGQQQNQ